MAGNVQLNWDRVTTRTDGSAVDPSTVRYRVSARVAGIPDWTELSTAPENSRLVPNLEGGTWHFQVVALDSVGPESAPRAIQTDVAYAPLSTVANLTATVT